MSSLNLVRAPWALRPGLAAALAVSTVGVVGGSFGHASATGMILFGACCAATLTQRSGPYRARAATLIAQCAGACLGLMIGSVTHSPMSQILAAIVVAFLAGLIGQLTVAMTGAAVMAVIGVALAQFGGLDLPWYQLLGGEIVGSALIGATTLTPWFFARGLPARAGTVGVVSRDRLPIRDRLRVLRIGVGLRIACCIAIATVAAMALDGHTHAYWIPITVSVLVRPEYGGVLFRTTNRLAGTIVGGIIAGSLLAVLPPGAPTGLAVGLAVGFAVAAAPKSYALSVVGITCGALLSTAIATPVADIWWIRIADTLIGATIAVVFGYLLWPRPRAAASSMAPRAIATAVTARVSPPPEPVPDLPGGTSR